MKGDTLGSTLNHEQIRNMSLALYLITSLRHRGCKLYTEAGIAQALTQKVFTPNFRLKFETQKLSRKVNWE